MSFFLGEFEIAMDAKGRIMLPAAFRKRFEEELELGFIIKRAIGAQCLEFYTAKSWKPIHEELESMVEFNPRVAKFKRLFLDGASEVEMDGSGRILIPKPLQEYANLSKKLLFASKGNKVEIWDRDAYYNYISENADELEDLASELWGDSVTKPKN